MIFVYNIFDQNGQILFKKYLDELSSEINQSVTILIYFNTK